MSKIKENLKMIRELAAQPLSIAREVRRVEIIMLKFTSIL